MGEVADLYATLGARVNASQWNAANQRIAGAKRAIDDLHGAFQDRKGRWRDATGRLLTTAEKAKAGLRGVGAEADKAAKKSGSAFGGISASIAKLGAVVGIAALGRQMISLNASAEEARNQIAGMLALSTKGKFTDQLGNADMLMANLQKRAASLPGTTADYISMLGNIVQPVTAAGLGMADLEDLTVGAVVAAKALGEDAAAAARDIGQALRGQAGADDPFIGKLLDTAGFTGQEGRQKFNAKTAAERAKVVKQLLTSSQLKDMAAAQGKTFSGTLATLEDSLQQFGKKAGAHIFDRLSKAIERANKWIDEHKDQINAVADTVGGVLSTAFDMASAAIDFFMENSEIAEAVLIALGIVVGAFAIKAAVAWAIAFGPIILAVAAIAALVYAIRKIIKEPDKVKAAFAAAWKFVADKADWLWGKLRAFGARVLEFFTDDVPTAIKDAFLAAFEYIADLPVVKQVIWAVKKGVQIAGSGEQALGVASSLGGMLVGRAPSLPATAAATPAGTSIGTVQVGGITVNSPNADPKAVATEAKKVFAEELGATLRRTRDVGG